MKTQAAILVESRQPLEVAEVEIPQLEFGQVLVRVHYSGICGSQIGEIDAVKGPDKYLPHLLGHEGGGVVEAVGPHVTTVKPGDHVVLHWRPGTGLQSAPPSYDWNGRKVNAGWVTTFNRHAVISENRLTVIPDSLGLDIAALYGCALTTGFGAISKNAQVRIGESVVIIGVGGVGMAAVMAAQLSGAQPIVALDLHDDKLALAKQLGATHVINSRDMKSNEIDAAIREIVGGQGADVVLENTGIPMLIEAAYHVAAKAGRTILVGVQEHDHPVKLDTMPLHFGKLLTGSHGGETTPEHDIPRYVGLQQAGRFDPSPLVSQRVSLEKINEGIAMTRRGDVVRCLVEMP